jgi:hypothetical protein
VLVRMEAVAELQLCTGPEAHDTFGGALYAVFGLQWRPEEMQSGRRLVLVSVGCGCWVWSGSFGSLEGKHERCVCVQV